MAIRANRAHSRLRMFVWHTGFMQRIALADFELSIFSDGTYALDGGAFFGVVPKVMWSRRVTVDEKNYVTAGLNSLLIRTGKQTVLVETGMGNKLSDRMIKFYGQPAKLLENLAAGGVAPEDVDIVINSHLHFDHCGWNTVRDKNGKIVPTFPRAKYYARRRVAVCAASERARQFRQRTGTEMSRQAMDHDTLIVRIDTRSFRRIYVNFVAGSCESTRDHARVVTDASRLRRILAGYHVPSSAHAARASA